MVLLQTKEEILEAINADIVSNGNKAITGDILNLIFNSLVELIGRIGGGGASAEEIISDFGGEPLTDEQKAKNAAAYAKAKAACEAGKPLPLFMVDLASLMAGSAAKMVVLASAVGFGEQTEGSNIMVLMLMMNFIGTELSLTVTEDGSCSIDFGSN